MAIYFIQCGDGGAVKIGYARNPYDRIDTLQIGSPVALSILKITEGSLRDELRFHARFADHRVRGEWYSPTPEMLEFIDGLPKWDGSLKQPNPKKAGKRTATPDVTDDAMRLWKDINLTARQALARMPGWTRKAAYIYLGKRGRPCGRPVLPR